MLVILYIHCIKIFLLFYFCSLKVMEIGRFGHNGRHVQSLVGAETVIDLENAITLSQRVLAYVMATNLIICHATHKSVLVNNSFCLSYCTQTYASYFYSNYN